MQSDRNTGIEVSPRSQTESTTSHDVKDDTADIRCNLPFVPVLPFPRAATIVKPVINVAIDIAIPDNSVLMKVSGLAPFFLSQNGQASGQDAATSSANGNPPGSCDVLIPAASDWILVSGKRMVSVMSPTAANSIGASFITRDQF